MEREIFFKKRAVIDKFYWWERNSYYHNFNIDSWICEYCWKFIWDEKNSRMCDIITLEEVENFNDVW